jgi:hypothetical protein
MDTPARTLLGVLDGVADQLEFALGTLAEAGNGRDADHDDQGQHHRVLDGGRAIFALHEAFHRMQHRPHGSTLQLMGAQTHLFPADRLPGSIAHGEGEGEGAGDGGPNPPSLITRWNPERVGLPILAMALKQTKMMSASRMAYSILVVPSSVDRHFRKQRASRAMPGCLS